MSASTQHVLLCFDVYLFTVKMSDVPVAMASLTELMQHLMKTVAKTHHLNEIHRELKEQTTTIKKVETRVGGVEDKFASLESRLRKVEAAQASSASSARRGSTGSTTSAGASPARQGDHCETNAWVPASFTGADGPHGVAHRSRNWTAQKLWSSRRRSRSSSRKDSAQRLRWLQPFIQNHAVSAEVLGAREGSAKAIADESMNKKPIYVRGVAIRVGVEISPSRREALRSFFASRDLVKQLNGDYNSTICSRSLEIWCDAGFHRLGWWQRDEALWRWSPWAASIAKVKLPIDYDKEDKGDNQDEKQESKDDDEDMAEEVKANEKDKDDEDDNEPQENTDPQGQKQPLPEGAKAAGTNKKKQRILKPCASCPEPSP